jgi:hypothetical protein
VAGYYNEKVWVGFIRLRMGAGGGSVKGGEFIE